MLITLSVIITLLLAVNLAVAWFWLVKRIDAKGYGRSSREQRLAKMMPVADRTTVVEVHNDGRDTVRTVRAEPGATAGAY